MLHYFTLLGCKWSQKEFKESYGIEYFMPQAVCSLFLFLVIWGPKCYYLHCRWDTGGSESYNPQVDSAEAGMHPRLSVPIPSILVPQFCLTPQKCWLTCAVPYDRAGICIPFPSLSLPILYCNFFPYGYHCTNFVPENPKARFQVKLCQRNWASVAFGHLVLQRKRPQGIP
jgi:hypothetical protein